MCSAAQVLHDDKLVHRDLRLPNVVHDQLGHQHYMVIDLESVANSAAKPLSKDFHNVLKTCTAEALDNSMRFTALSDMFCIGVLLKKVESSRATPYSVQANHFIHKLLGKESTATAALMCSQCEWCPQWQQVLGKSEQIDQCVTDLEINIQAKCALQFLNIVQYNKATIVQYHKGTRL